MDPARRKPETPENVRDPKAPAPLAGDANDASVPREQSRRTRVLLVDDQPSRLLTYDAILSGLDVECVWAFSGTEALARLLKQDFAVLILDVNMPEMDGFELARLIREHPRLERTPIIFVTAVNVSEFDRLRGYEVGAIDYISVPIVPEILRSKVAVLVELHQRRNELQRQNHALADTHARSDAEHAKTIANQEARLSAVFEHPNEVIVVLRAERDDEGEIVDWVYQEANANALALLGRARDALVGRGLSQVLPAERVAMVSERCARVLLTRTPEFYESRFGTRDFRATIFSIGGDSVVSSGVDVTEARRAEEALRESDRRKDEFLAMLAHELRNPVAPIGNVAEVLTRMLAGDEEKRRLAEIIRRQAMYLSRLLDDLLDVARMTQGRIELRRTIVPLAGCIQQAVETAQPLIREREHRLTMTDTLQPLHVNADRVRLVQAISNIVINAAKYTSVGGEIRIRTQATHGEAVIEISDTGTGIAPEFLPRVFDLFAQSGRALDRSQGGLGIGLAVCQRLVEMHHGTVSAHSEGLGHGSTFTIRLPLADAPPDAASLSQPASVPFRRVLVVDDNLDSADSLALLLELEGHTVRAVYSAADALEQVGTFEPDVVLLDIGLPGMNGYDVARRMTTLAHPPRLVAVSGYGQREDKERSAAAGFSDHLVKPVDPMVLKKLLIA